MIGSTAQPINGYRKFCFCLFFALYAGIMMFIFSYWQHLFALAYMQPLSIVAAAALNLTGVPAELYPSSIQYFHQSIMILANIGFSTFVMLLWFDRTQKNPVLHDSSVH